MKEHRLAAWPDLGPQHRRTAYRRLLSDMSQRHVSLAELCARSHELDLESKTWRAEAAQRELVSRLWPTSLYS